MNEEDRLAESSRIDEEGVEEHVARGARPRLRKDDGGSNRATCELEVFTHPCGCIHHGLVRCARNEVDSDEEHATLDEDEVLRAYRLMFHVWDTAEFLLQPHQVLLPKEPPLVGVGTVDPFVVPRNDEGGDGEAREPGDHAFVAILGARLAPAEDVTDVHDELRTAVEIVIVQVLQEGSDLVVAVGRISQHGEGDRPSERISGSRVHALLEVLEVRVPLALGSRIGCGGSREQNHKPDQAHQEPHASGGTVAGPQSGRFWKASLRFDIHVRRAGIPRQYGSVGVTSRSAPSAIAQTPRERHCQRRA
jgi:hypothetical protein